ncbi:hypothetical protein CC86DRAFT_372090 [Ophiobolus disseminans]|uniref:Uncharacterized protein n=1 Tax=Ophiobolus disseminans TaxID=1469910 RepID=A0A6A6ZS77_9PLEO|nr:hypothetical protein CC86DRAFT_372090 [Ophiobolus disseminans]
MVLARAKLRGHEPECRQGEQWMYSSGHSELLRTPVLRKARLRRLLHRYNGILSKLGNTVTVASVFPMLHAAGPLTGSFFCGTTEFLGFHQQQQQGPLPKILQTSVLNSVTPSEAQDSERAGKWLELNAGARSNGFVTRIIP